MIKRIIALLIASVVSCFLVPQLILWLVRETNFHFQTFGILFIFPVGSICVGFFVGAVYSIVLKLMNVKIIKVDYLLLFFLSLMTVTSLYYTIYANTYVGENGEIFYSS